MASSKGRTFQNRSISFPPALLAAAQERASRLGLSFSAYVQRCIEKDLSSRSALVLEEREPLPAAAQPASSEDRGAKRERRSGKTAG